MFKLRVKTENGYLTFDDFGSAISQLAKSKFEGVSTYLEYTEDLLNWSVVAPGIVLSIIAQLITSHHISIVALESLEADLQELSVELADSDDKITTIRTKYNL